MRAGYFLSGGPLTPFPGPPFSKMAAESNFPPWDVQDVKFLPPPQILGQTIDRCIRFSLWWINFLYQFICCYSTNHWFDRFFDSSFFNHNPRVVAIGEDSPRLLQPPPPPPPPGLQTLIADIKACLKSKSSFKFFLSTI